MTYFARSIIRLSPSVSFPKSVDLMWADGVTPYKGEIAYYIWDQALPCTLSGERRITDVNGVETQGLLALGKETTMLTAVKRVTGFQMMMFFNTPFGLQAHGQPSSKRSAYSRNVQTLY